MADTDILDKPVDEQAQVREADTLAAAKLARGMRGGRDPITLPAVKSNDDYDALMPGMRYRDPQGNVRTKPYSVQTDEEYEDIPENAQYRDPQGNIRTKPRYQDVDFTTQVLYNMAVNDKERRKALERAYPGKVKERGGRFYVDDNGVLRAPQSGRSYIDERGEKQSYDPWSAVVAGTAPTVGAIGGDILGGVAGAETGPGAIATGALGGAAGGVAGQGINDIVLGLAGVYDRTAGEEVKEVGGAGIAGGLGAGAGRVLSAAAPAITGALKTAAPKAVANFLGADEEALTQALALRQKGVLVPPSLWAKEAPHVVNIVEVFDPAFRLQKPLLESATGHYERSVGEILESIGIKPEGKISEPGAAASTQAAGEAILRKRLEAQSAADAKLDLAIKDAEVRATLGSVAQKGAARTVEQTAAESRKAAQALIDQGFADIQTSVNDAMRVARAGHNSGDLWQAVGEKLIKIRQGIAERAKVYYAQADRAAGGHLPDTSGLPELAQDFLDQLPEPFQAKYPDAVRRLRDLAGTPKPETAAIKQRIAQIQIDLARAKIKPDSNTAALQQELVGLRQQLLDTQTSPWLKEPVEPTFGQLHELRTWFRSNVNWYDLTPDAREGAYKFFAKRIDDALHDKEAVPELQIASQLLDSTDRWYAEQIKPLQDQRIQAVIKGMESGLPADPKVLFDTLVKEGRSDLTKKVADLAGPNLWAGVKAADVQSMLDASKTLVPDVIDGNTFAREVLSRYRTGMLEAVHGKEASAKLIEQAQHIAMLNGKIDIPVRPGDKIADVIAKAREAERVAKAAADKDPLSVLDRETKKIRAEHQRSLAQTRRTDPLGFIYQPTVGVAEAVDRILGSEDLILAAGARFGEKSPEFNMLRQVWAQRILMGTLDPGARLAKVSPEVQQIMFPGISGEQMKLLAKEMDFLLGSKAVGSAGGAGAGPSMSAFAKVEHPWASIPLGKTAGKLIPGFDAAGRAMLGKFYKLVTELSNNPLMMRFVERGLKGDAVAQARTRAAIARALRRGGAIGAGLGEAEFQAPNQ